MGYHVTDTSSKVQNRHMTMQPKTICSQHANIHKLFISSIILHLHILCYHDTPGSHVTRPSPVLYSRTKLLTSECLCGAIFFTPIFSQRFSAHHPTQQLTTHQNHSCIIPCVASNVLLWANRSDTKRFYTILCGSYTIMEFPLL